MIKKSLLSLALGTFAIGMTEFTMMGILPDIAKDLNIDIPSAGHLISLYALGVVIGSPILVLFTAKYSPRKVLIFLMLLFAVFNALFAVSPIYSLLLVSRFMAGLPHGAFFGVGSVVAAKFADPGKKAQAIAIMVTGMTIANLIGVPLGTYIGHHFSWRYTYLIISLFGLLSMLSIYFWIPKMQPLSQVSKKSQLAYFKTKKAWVIIGMVSIGTGGLFAWLSYIAPLMTEITKINEDGIPFVMVLVGLGMIIGNLLGGKLADIITPQKTVTVSFIFMMLCLIIIYFTAHIPFMSYSMAFITGVAAFSCSSPIQMLLIDSAEGSESIAAAGGQSSFNLGNTMGAFFGGLPITYGYAYNSPLLIGVGMVAIGICFSYYYLVLLKTKD
ncbi:MFS transporter [Polaribacter sp. HaHaR_3_91]|uniref:MFS transporter n=1 Tax=Polaribacter sp. HaHaR_3_91 TaxID=2745561 RepID=UPI0020C809E4|nr:MFS transporter [Polaribacter sp. HaHaR_3_91]